MSDLSTFEFTDLEGRTQTMRDYAGKVLLVVNVASKCGFTPQYAGLQALWQRYRERGLVVIGFPCDQFGHQEPGDAAQIRQFCSLDYAVDFPLAEKSRSTAAARIRCGNGSSTNNAACSAPGDQVEFHQIPDRPRRPRAGTLCAHDQAGSIGRRYRACIGRMIPQGIVLNL